MLFVFIISIAEFLFMKVYYNSVQLFSKKGKLRINSMEKLEDIHSNLHASVLPMYFESSFMQSDWNLVNFIPRPFLRGSKI